MTQLKQGIQTLEQQLSEQEQTNTAKDTKTEENKLIALQVKVDRLEVLVSGNAADSTTRFFFLIVFFFCVSYGI